MGYNTHQMLQTPGSCRSSSSGNVWFCLLHPKPCNTAKVQLHQAKLRTDHSSNHRSHCNACCCCKAHNVELCKMHQAKLNLTCNRQRVCVTMAVITGSTTGPAVAARLAVWSCINHNESCLQQANECVLITAAIVRSIAWPAVCCKACCMEP